MSTTGFHEGELSVQARAGALGAAQRLSGMLAPADLDGGAGRFLAAQTFAVVTARDDAGRLWSSPLVGPPGFLAGAGTSLDIAAAPAAGDPLAELPPGQEVGLIVLDLGNRRRLRVNGTLRVVTGGRLQIEVEQVYGNCPQYIRRRHVEAVPASPAPAHMVVGDSLTPDQIRWIEHADTFFLGTTHPTRGADSSHRGGPPGFVRVSDGGLWWPDYPGNAMFNSPGNLAVDDAAALLFPDFSTGATLHLSGTASVVWTGAEGHERRVRFELERLSQGAGLGVRETGPDDRTGGHP